MYPCIQRSLHSIAVLLSVANILHTTDDAMLHIDPHTQLPAMLGVVMEDLAQSSVVLLRNWHLHAWACTGAATFIWAGAVINALVCSPLVKFQNMASDNQKIGYIGLGSMGAGMHATMLKRWVGHLPLRPDIQVPAPQVIASALMP